MHNELRSSNFLLISDTINLTCNLKRNRICILPDREGSDGRRAFREAEREFCSSEAWKRHSLSIKCNKPPVKVCVNACSTSHPFLAAPRSRINCMLQYRIEETNYLLLSYLNRTVRLLRGFCKSRDTSITSESPDMTFVSKFKPIFTEQFCKRHGAVIDRSGGSP